MLNLFITQSLAEKESSAASNFDPELLVRQFRGEILFLKPASDFYLALFGKSLAYSIKMSFTAKQQETGRILWKIKNCRIFVCNEFMKIRR